MITRGVDYGVFYEFVPGEDLGAAAPRRHTVAEVEVGPQHVVSLNAFGENVIVEEVERALGAACRRAHAEAVEFTVAPRYPSAQEPRGGHDWLVEFAEPPRCSVDVFRQALDETLMTLNTDYRTKRTAGMGMVEPRVIELPAGTFCRWMRETGRLGDQHNVPRVTNDRVVADRLLDVAARPLSLAKPRAEVLSAR